MPHTGPIPKAAVFRLSLYLRELSGLHEKGVDTVSSLKLGNLLGLTDAQVRKDLAYFGQFGYPWLGYHVEELIGELKRILGTDRMWDVVLIGCGNLGRALAAYKGFHRQGFRVVAAFDADPVKAGHSIGELAVRPMSELAPTVARTGSRIAIICVPSDQAQEVADRAVSAGIRGILNFASTSISTPAHVVENSVDLAIRLEQLSFQLRSMEQDAQG
jgi:redox-sensing transcriptional repressor